MVQKLCLAWIVILSSVGFAADAPYFQEAQIGAAEEFWAEVQAGLRELPPPVELQPAPARLVRNPRKPEAAVFTSIALVPQPGAYPWSVNCKVFTDFGQGSAVMVSPYYALTAGHLTQFYDEATNSRRPAKFITVVPGYDRGYEPYGRANASWWWSWWEPENGKKVGYDLSLVQLDRRLGSGAHGFFYNNNCFFFRWQDFTSAGYPGGYYSGQQMYWFHGTFDQCMEVPALIVNSRSFPGQSGSGVYTWTDDYSLWTVYGVLTHASITPPWTTYFTKVTQGRFEFIRNTIYGAPTPTATLHIPTRTATPTRTSIPSRTPTPTPGQSGGCGQGGVFAVVGFAGFYLLPRLKNRKHPVCPQ